MIFCNMAGASVVSLIGKIQREISASIALAFAGLQKRNSSKKFVDEKNRRAYDLHPL